MGEADKILTAIRRFTIEMAIQGITITGFEVASDADEYAIASSVPRAVLMPIGLSADQPRTAVNGVTVTVRRSRHA